MATRPKYANPVKEEARRSGSSSFVPAIGGPIPRAPYIPEAALKSIIEQLREQDARAGVVR